MTLSINKQSWLAALAFVALAALVIFEPLDEPRLTIMKSILFWPTVIWLAWLAWTQRAHLKTTANAGGVVRPVAIVAAIAAVLILARWIAANTGLAQ